MKKIIIGVALAIAAVGSQAATIKWTSNSMALTDAEGTAISSLGSGSLVLVVMSSATDWENATVIDTAASTTLEKTTLAISTRAATLGQVSGTLSFTYNATDTSGNLVNNGDYLALMFLDGDSKLNQLTYTSGTNDGKPVDAVLQVSGLVNNSTSLSSQKILMSGNFTAVPEPTSAMLMLLGVAGLALRRRRA